MTFVLNQAFGDNWALYHADSCLAMAGIPDNSVHLSVYSPPFESLYIYSDSENDLGNSADSDEFFQHYQYIIKEMHRITVPGRVSVVHCKDLPLYKGTHGHAGLHDFPGLIIKAHEAAGWVFHSRVTIWKDPVIEMERTNNHGLLYKSTCADSSMCRAGMADYLLTFRKWEGLDGLTGPDPVVGTDAERFDRYVGVQPPDAGAIAQRYHERTPARIEGGGWPRYNPFTPGSQAYRRWSIHVWQKYASPVWFDIDQTDVLNYEMAKAAGDERHICPLQLDVIERAIHLYSNAGDIVFSPFAGVGSELYVARQVGRRGIGIELKGSYFETGVQFLQKLDFQQGQRTLFDALGEAA